MNRYEIRCSEEQTKKALELGAPIENTGIYQVPQWVKINDTTYKIPTAEQMIGFLRSKGFKFLLCDEKDIQDGHNWWLGINGEIISSGYDDVKEIAAIDAALKYLMNKK